METFNKVLDLFQSPRFVSFYWRTGGMALITLLNLISESLTTLGLPAWVVVLIGLAIGEGTKALNNAMQDKPMGFQKVN